MKAAVTLLTKDGGRQEKASGFKTFSCEQYVKDFFHDKRTTGVKPSQTSSLSHTYNDVF